MAHAHRRGIVPLIVRALLWTLLVLAPGGVLLLPLLVGDALTQRKKRDAQDSLAGVEPVVTPLSLR
jgi:hypothetical protein